MLLAASVLVSLSMATLASASSNSYTVNSSDGASCSQNEQSGSQVEFGTDLDSVTNEGRVFVKWVVKVGHEDLSKIDCSRLYNIEVQMQELQLDRLKMEIAMLKAQLANPNSKDLPASGDDW